MVEPTPWIGHMPFGWWVVQEVRPKTLVELGTHTGNSYFSFCQAVAEHQLPTKCYAIDTWEGDTHSGTYGEDIYRSVSHYNQDHYSPFSSLMRMTFDSALQSFQEGGVDLLHIDGLHTYEAVRHDFESWQPKLSPNAIVFFHDTNVYSEGFGVWKYFQELSAKYKNHLEFRHSCGLGVIQMGSEGIQKEKKWLHAGSSEQLMLIELFDRKGGELEKIHRKNEKTKRSPFRRAIKAMVDRIRLNRLGRTQ